MAATFSSLGILGLCGVSREYDEVELVVILTLMVGESEEEKKAFYVLKVNEKI